MKYLISIFFSLILFTSCNSNKEEKVELVQNKQDSPHNLFKNDTANLDVNTYNHLTETEINKIKENVFKKQNNIHNKEKEIEGDNRYNWDYKK